MPASAIQEQSSQKKSICSKSSRVLVRIEEIIIFSRRISICSYDGCSGSMSFMSAHFTLDLVASSPEVSNVCATTFT